MHAKIFDEDVREFIHQDKGLFVVFSNDTLFAKNLRTTLVRHLQIKEDCVLTAQNSEHALRELKTQTTLGHKVLLFLEREMNGKPSHEVLKAVKAGFSNALVVVLTGEVAKEILIFLHEIGADNIITKPISPDLLIEKIAFTVKPRGQIGELMEAGNRLIEQNQPEQAAAVAKQILEIKANSPAGLILLGDSLKLSGRAKEALSAYQLAAKNAHLYLEPIKRIAQLHKETGNVREETKCLEKLDRISPLNVERKIAIGENYMTLGEPDRATEAFDAAIHIARREAVAQVSRVTSTIAEHCMGHSPEMAEAYYRQALENKKGDLDQSDLDTFNRLGISLRKQGRWNDAVDEYRKALKIAPKDAGLHYNMAMAYVDGKRQREAEECLLKALAASPEFYQGSETACANMAMIFHAAGNLTRAREFAQRVLDINPDSKTGKALVRAF